MGNEKRTYYIEYDERDETWDVVEDMVPSGFTVLSGLTERQSTEFSDYMQSVEDRLYALEKEYG